MLTGREMDGSCAMGPGRDALVADGVMLGTTYTELGRQEAAFYSRAAA